MRRHEKVQPQHARLRGQALRDGADREAGAVAGQHGRSGCELHQLRKQGLFGRQFFRDAFDHQRSVWPMHLRQGGDGLDLVSSCHQAQRLQTRAHMRHELFALGRIRVRDGNAAAPACEHDGHIGTHGACAYDDSVGVAGMVR